MALTETLELLLTADPSQGIGALRQFSSEAEKTATKSTSSFQKIATSAMKLGAGGMAAGGFLTQMAAGDIEAANQLEAAIRQAGQTQSDYTDRINDTIGAMAEFGHTDEEVSGALTALTLAYGDTAAGLDQMQLVADLAARKHTTLADAAGMVAKAHGGSARLFKEFGVEVRANADGTKDYDGALTDLAGKLSGQAAAAADSWSGQLREIRANVENLVSEFGQNFGPMILGVSTGVTALGGVFSGTSALIDKFRGSAEAASKVSLGTTLMTAGAMAAPLAAVLPLIAVSLKGQADSAAEAARNTNTYAEALKKTTGTMQENIDMATAQNLANSKNFQTLADAGIDLQLLGDQVTDATDEFQTFSDQILDAATSSTDFSYAINNARDSTDPFVQSLIRLHDTGEITDGELETIIRTTGALREEYGNAKTNADNLTAAQQALGGGIETVGAAADTTNRSLDDMKTRYKEIEQAADDAFTATLKLAPADIRVRQGALQIADAQAKQAEAEEALRVARFTGDPAKIEAAERDLANAKLDVISAVEDEAVAVAELKETQDAANGITTDAATKTQNYLNALTFLNAGLTGPTHDALATYIWDVTVAANKTEELRVAALGGTGFTGQFTDLSRSAANRAGGGTGFPGSTYFIEPGTKGEYFTPSSSGWFTPVDKMGKGGYTVNIGQIVTADPVEAAAQMARRLRIEATLASP